MAHLEKQNSRLTEVFQACSEAGADPLKGLLRHTIQQILEEELTAFLNAGPYTRTEDRQGYRNGYKPRMLNTRVGRLELMVPKDREGRFRTELFERYQRSEKALMLALVEMYVQGVSTRRVRKITEELCGLEVSKSQVSSLAKGLDEEVRVWRTRPLTKRYSYLMVDALYEKVRQGGMGTSRGVLTVIGIDAEGYREILGVWCMDTENETNWSQVFGELKERGLAGVAYVVSDGHGGLVKAIRRHFQGVIWQRCQVHFIRNAMDVVPKRGRAAVLACLREITGASCLESARARLREAVHTLEETHPRVAELLDAHGEEMLAVYSLPEHHRRRMHSTNMQERFNKEIRRRTRVVGVFPNEAACIRLVSALAIEQNEEWMVQRYLNMEPEENRTEANGRKDLIRTPVQLQNQILSQ
jgi:transposase-like protein